MNQKDRLQSALELAEAIRVEANGHTPCMDDPDRWYPEQSSDTLDFTPATLSGINATKAECKTHCFVVAECLNYALKNREDMGIWGGTSAVERRQLRALRKKMSDPNAKVNF